MKFTLSWLRDHLDTQAESHAIADTLTRIGLEVEHLADPAAGLRGFVVARVLSAEPHPNADRLRVCQVEAAAGATPVQVVCGAPNARTGMVSVFSPIGTFIPGKKVTLGAGVIRGVESNGMLCSAAELELSDDHEGILDLPADAPVGTPYAVYAGLDDPVFTVNLTPNRPDAAGVAGIARDLAAAGLGRLRTPPIEPIEGGAPCPVGVVLDLAAADAPLAPAFALRRVAGVRNGPSPPWMQARLRAVGLLPINAHVDITNYLSIDRARPLHVFDAAKVEGSLHVRRARGGESLRALDGKTYPLLDNDVVIADARGPASIAGVMGGEATGCDEATTDVLIESALWQPAAVAATGRRLGIVSDARYRFERGVDPAFCLPGLDLATALVVGICGGTPSDRVLAGHVPQPDHRVAFPPGEVKRLTGLDLPVAETVAILQALGFAVAAGDVLSVKVPSWRPDIHGKADLVEEVVRIAGVGRVAPQPLPPLAGEGVPAAMLTPLQRRTRQAKRALAAAGLVEAVTWSFVSRQQAELFAGGRAALALANPISADLSDMRPSLLPGLVAAAGRNMARGFNDLALFEVGQIFRGDREGDQKTAAAAVRTGTAGLRGSGRHWSGAAPAAGMFDAKSDALALLAALGVPTGGLQVVPGASDAFHPGRSMVLRFGPKTLVGQVGEMHPRTLAAMDVAGPLVAFEIVLDDLPFPKIRSGAAKTSKPRLDLPDFMPLARDFAFILDQSVAAGDVVRAVQQADRTLVGEVTVFDIYEGQGVAEGKKSVAVSATLQPREKTLTDAEIDALMGKIIADVVKKTGAVLRG